MTYKCQCFNMVDSALSSPWASVYLQLGHLKTSAACFRYRKTSKNPYISGFYRVFTHIIDYFGMKIASQAANAL